MKKNINIRNLIIVMLCITIIFMGIGFVFLASKLDEEKNRHDTFKVEITKVEALTSIKGGTIDPQSTKELYDDGKTVRFNFTLNSPNYELAYEITIKNTGDTPAEILRLIATPDYVNDTRIKSMIEPVSITHTSVENKKLLPSETVTVKLLIKYNMTATPRQVYIPFQLTVLATSINK